MFPIAAILALVLALIAVALFRRRGADARPAGRPKATDLTATTSKFHAVAIRPGLEACKAALELQGQRFLSEAAPPIPLPGCDARNCQCRFVHFADRRSGDDRRSPYPATIGIDTAIFRQEQRQRGDRRRNPPTTW